MKKTYVHHCPVCNRSLTTKLKRVECSRCSGQMQIVNEWLDSKDITKLKRVRGFRDAV